MKAKSSFEYVKKLQWLPIQMRAFHPIENGLFCTHPLSVVPLFFGGRMNCSFEWKILIWIGRHSTHLVNRFSFSENFHLLFSADYAQNVTLYYLRPWVGRKKNRAIGNKSNGARAKNPRLYLGHFLSQTDTHSKH